MLGSGVPKYERADLTGSLYDQWTVFPSGGDADSGAAFRGFGTTGDATPWERGIVSAPEPAFGRMQWIVGLALAAMGRHRYPASPWSSVQLVEVLPQARSQRKMPRFEGRCAA